MNQQFYAAYAISANDVAAGAKFNMNDMIAENACAQFSNNETTHQALTRMMSRPSDVLSEPKFGPQNQQAVYMPAVVVSGRVEVPEHIAESIQHAMKEQHIKGLESIGDSAHHSMHGCIELDSKVTIGADILHHPQELTSTDDISKTAEILQNRQNALQRVVEMGNRSSDMQAECLDMSKPEDFLAVRFAYAPHGYVQQPVPYTPLDRYGHSFFEEIANKCSAAVIREMPQMYEDYQEQFKAYQKKFPDKLPAAQAAYAMRNAVILHTPSFGKQDMSVMKSLEDAALTHMSMSDNIKKVAQEYCEKAGIDPQSEMAQHFTTELAMTAFTQQGTQAEIVARTVEKVGQDGYDVVAKHDFQALQCCAQEARDAEIPDFDEAEFDEAELS